MMRRLTLSGDKDDFLFDRQTAYCLPVLFFVSPAITLIAIYRPCGHLNSLSYRFNIVRQPTA